jgi:hypothetical protein
LPAAAAQRPVRLRASFVAASLVLATAAGLWLTIEPLRLGQNAGHETSGELAQPAHSPEQPPAGNKVANVVDTGATQSGTGVHRHRRSVGSPLRARPAFQPPELTGKAYESSYEDSYFFDRETARHLQRAQILLRSFDNGSYSSPRELACDRAESRQLVFSNILLRREAERADNAPARSLLDNLEPLLLDIANLPDNPRLADLTPVKERIRSSEIVATLQVYSTGITSVDY